jgi:DNA-binding protein YbaB
LGGVVGIIEQFEALRSSQRLGSQTSQLLSELRNSVAAEGHSHGNSVRVVLDGTQRVRSVEFADEHFLRTSEPYEVSAAVVEAFQNAHAKSVEKMDERLKNFYTKASAHSPIGNLWS